MISILYVDDETILLDATKLYLEKTGNFSVDTAGSAGEALQKMQDRTYDAVVADYQMPGTDGIAFLKNLRAAGNTIPFIVFTGKGREEVVIEAHNAGADSYVRKSGEPRVMFLDLTTSIEHAVSRRRMESELAFRNVLLQTQQEVSLDGILIVGDTGRILSFNKRFVAMWEVPPEMAETGEDENLLNHNLQLVADRRQFLARVQYLYEHRSETSRDEILLADGRTLDRYSAPLTGTKGEYYGRIWYFRDITETKRAGEALRESAEKYRTLIESANEAIFIIQDGMITYSNPMGLSLLGIPADQLAQHGFLDFVFPDDRAEALDHHRKRLRGEIPEPRWQLRILNVKGAVHWIELDAVLIEWNGRPATLNFATDITIRKTAQQALLESEAKFREIFNNANDSIEISEVGPDGLPGRYTDVNDVSCRRLGYSRDELLKMSPLLIATSYHNMSLEEIGKNLLTRGHVIFETEHRRKDGSIIPVEVNSHVTVLSGKKVVLSVVRDITERKRGEQALRESEERFKQIAENAGEWIWELNEEGVYTYSSPAVEKILGYSTEEIVGKMHFYDLFVPETREAMKSVAFAVLSRHEPFRGFVNQNQHKNGERVFIETGGAPIRDATGRFVGYRGADTDITQRKNAEEALARSGSLLEDAMDQAHMANWEFDLPSLTFTFNDRFYNLYGSTAEREGGYLMPIEEYTTRFVHPEDRGIVADETLKVLATTDPGFRAHFEHRIIRRDGQVRYVVVRFGPTKEASGRVTGAHGANQDITEQREVEQALEESERKYRSVIENIQDVFYRTDNNGVLIMGSPSLARVLGCTSVTECIGVPFADRFYASPEKRASLLREMEKKGFVDNYEVDLVRADGIPIVISANSHFYYDHKGNVLGVEGVFRDITDHKKADLALKGSLYEKELLLKEIHHRVKNNLQTISSILYLQSLSTENEEGLAVIREARARVTSMGLIHQKLYQSADIATIPFMDYVRSLIDFLSESYGVDRDRVRIAIDVQPPDLSLDIDTGIPCGLMINELITNALKYAFRGRPTGTIGIRMSRDEHRQYTLSVSDDGIGLPPDFDPGTAKTLGMKLVSGLVSQLDGTMEIGGGPGTTIIIRFPSGADPGPE